MWEGIIINITDIARMAGVSKGTVSRVINNSKDGVSEETRARILSIIEEVGYIPNRMAGSIAIAKTKTLGLIIPDIQNMFFPQMVRGVENCAIENGYTLFLCNTDSDIKKEELYLRAFMEKRVDGILINTCGDMGDRSLLRSIIQSGIPIVLLDRKSNDFADKPGVFIDNKAAAYAGVEYLIHTGCRKILFLCGPKEVFTSSERLKGYREALSMAGISYRESYVTYGTHTAEYGYTAIKELLAQHSDIDAVFTGADTIAFGVLRALNEMNITVPDQISVMGFDNIMLGEYVSPPLTTVAQPIYDIGYRAVKKLISCIRREPGCSENEFMKTRIVRRGTTR